MLDACVESVAGAEFEAELRARLPELLPPLQARAHALCRNDADARDLVNDSILRALAFSTSFRPGTHLRAWLLQIMFSVFVTRCRKSRRERRALERLANDPCAWTRNESVATTDPLPAPFKAALDGLPQHFASVIRLVDLEDHSYREAAAELDVPLGTIMSRLFRGRRLLARALPQASAGLDHAA